jgi:anti-sigma regulatory factor (Ser/Thr protein kinase)
LSEPAETITFAHRLDCLGAGAQLRRRCLQLGWPPQDAGEAALVLIELTTNAVRHGHGGEARVNMTPAQVDITVEDRGPGFPAWLLERWARRDELAPLFSVATPHPLNANGLGAGLDGARRMCDRLVLSNREGGGARVQATRSRRSQR